MKRIFLVVALASVVAPTDRLEAQESLPPLAPGVIPVYTAQRVRVVAQEANGVFTVADVVLDTLVLERPSGGATERIRVPVSSIQRLEVSRGGRTRASGAGRGALVGFAGGALLGWIVAEIASCIDPFGAGSGCDDAPARDKALVAVAFGVPTGAIGGIVGALVSGERWRAVPVPSGF